MKEKVIRKEITIRITERSIMFLDGSEIVYSRRLSCGHAHAVKDAAEQGIEALGDAVFADIAEAHTTMSDAE